MTVLIVDDHSIVREGLKSMLCPAHPDWKIIEAENGVQAILAATKAKPDLILMDQMMPKLNGIKASSLIVQENPESKIIMITMCNPEYLLQGAMDAGIKLIIPKDSPNKEILNTIDEFTNGSTKNLLKKKKNSIKGNSNTRKQKAGNHSVSLFFTDRELEIVGLMMKGNTTKNIANYLGISIRTVDGHKFKIMKKCHVHSFQEFYHFIISNKVNFLN
jgi:DNA-binding NarL/FixJ family response regulator